MNNAVPRMALWPRITLVVFMTMAALPARAAGPLLVATASNMSQAMEEIRDSFSAASGEKVRLISGSSGNFTSQILQGAPFHVFLSASGKYVDLLLQKNHNIVTSSEVARGRIGLFVPASSSLADKTTLEGVLNSIKFSDFGRLSIANPEFAPYGVAAKQVLETAGIWVLDENKLLVGENAAQAAQFCLAGGVDLGIIPYSYASIPEIRNAGRFFLIPEAWHKPIHQYLVILDKNGGSATRFFNYMFTDSAQSILRRYGYEPTAQK